MSLVFTLYDKELSGDSYAATVLFNTVTKRFSLTSWGDFVEKNSKRYKID